MQREFKNTGVSPLSVGDAYNRYTHKIYLAQCMSQVLPNHASPGEDPLDYSNVCQTMISSE